MASVPTPPTGDRASALAERLGMTREAALELMQQTHSEYENASLPPSEPHTEVPIEQAAKTLAPAREPVPLPAVRRASKPLSGGFIAAIFIALLIGLAIAASFRQGCFARRGRTPNVPPDTISAMMKHAAAQASTPPQPPTTVQPGQVPPEALVVPQEEPPGVTGAPTNSGITTEAQAKRSEMKPVPKPVLVTPSNFEAEEELATLHAEGNSRAYMSAVHRQSGVMYRVYAHP